MSGDGVVYVEVAADDLIRKDVPEPERRRQRYAPAYCCYLYLSVLDGTFVCLGIDANIELQDYFRISMRRVAENAPA